MDWEVRLRQQYAIAVRPEWLEQVVSQLRMAHADFSAWPEDRIVEKIFTAFLFCDLNQAGSASLPANTKEMHKEVLMGRFVLQLDEVVNMAAAARERYADQASGRCLKIALTDGCQQVVGVEHAHLPALTWDCPAGSKVLIHNVPIRRGLLLLGPDNTALLGGQVDRLEAARQRAVAAWTKPVVGRPAGSAERDIFAEARQAAWAPGTPATGPPRLGPAGVPAGAGTQGVSMGAQPQGGMRQVPPPAGSSNGVAAGPGTGAASPPPQQGHMAQAPHTHQQQQHPPQAVITGIRGQALATGAGTGAAAAALAQVMGPPWQHAPATCHGQQQQQPQPQHQGWNHHQPQAATQPKGPTPPTQAGAPVGAPAATPWLGRSANSTLGGSASASGSGGAGGAVGRGLTGAGAFPVVDLATSSESGAAGDSQSRIFNGQAHQGHLSIPHTVVPQPEQQTEPNAQNQQQQQEPLHRRRLPPSIPSGASLLGGSAAAPPPAGAAAAPGLGPSTSSSGLLPPRPATAAAAQRAGLLQPPALPPTPASAGTSALAGGTTGGPRKPALPLARSSPGPSGSLGSVGRCVASTAAAPSPTASTAALSGGPVQGVAQRSLFPGHATGARGGRGGDLAVDVEMVDLAALDDDEDASGGSDCAVGTGGGALPGTSAGPQRIIGQRSYYQQQQHTQAGKAKLQPPLDPADRTEKRPRLSPAQLDGVGGNSSFGGSGGDNASAVRLNVGLQQREGQDDAGAGARTGMAGADAKEKLAQMDVDSSGTCEADRQPSGTVMLLSGRHAASVAAAGVVAAAHNIVDAMAVEVDLDMAHDAGGLPGEWPDPTGTDSVAVAVDPAAIDGYGPGQGEAGLSVGNHAGVVALCQVPDLLQPDPDSDTPMGFPVTLDVYGMFYTLEGDVALIEDGTSLVEAVLTDRALAPLLANTEPPPGFTAGAPIGIADIQAMAWDSEDSALQQYGQDLADRLMVFIRDFSGLIRLEYREPLPTQPLIVKLTPDGDENGVETGGGCHVYEKYLQELGALGPHDEEEGEAQETGEVN